MSSITGLTVVGLLLAASATPALAAEACKIDQWRVKPYEYDPDYYLVEGLATCETGSMTLRLYREGQWIGNAGVYVENYAFTEAPADTGGVKPDEIR